MPILTPEEGEDPFATAAPADVVVVEPGCVVAAGWLEGLTSAARAQSTTATATALTPTDLDQVRGDQDRSDQDLGETAAAVRSGSVRLLPRVAAARGPCLYVRRSALDLVGGFDAEFSARCADTGLSHVLADDVLVRYEGADPGPPLRSLHGDDGPLARSLGSVRRALDGLSAVIDARILYGPTTGTHVHVLEVIAGLAGTGRVRLTVIVPEDASDYATRRLESIPGLALRTYDELSRAGGERADVVHRPFQVSNPGDLNFLRSIGERLILTQQDLIAFHNPAYFPSQAAWEGYRRLTRLALATADRVVFFSEHAHDDAIAEELVEPAHASVVRLGVDHGVDDLDRAPAPPAGGERLNSGAPAILCLGTDFLHKNRVFALRILERLKARHAWEGMLVFAGPAVRFGSSRSEEARLLAGEPQLSDSVLDLGAVSEAEKAWLLERAALVVYPSVLEGFGLVPFEAAAHGVPCMWAPGSSLSEMLLDSAAEIVAWDAEQSAERALVLLTEPAARERNLAAIRTAGAELSWKATAQRLVELYLGAANARAAPAGASSGLGLDGPGAAAGAISEDAMRLIGPGGELPADVHRPLLALATHPRIASPVFASLKLGYRASYALRRWRGRRSQP